jgi:DNA end-binding protein Ku
MAGRPNWSGQFKISLVSFGIQLYSATETTSGVTFHQLDRATGQRIRHLNVTGDDRQPVENAEIVKGYEYSKGKYLVVEPSEIAKVRIPTKNVIEVQQFVNISDLSPALFEKPYFVTPEPKQAVEAFAVVRSAMKEARKAAIGEIAFGGREHLVAITASDGAAGMMAYMLRYGTELRKSEDYFSEIPQVEKIDKKQLAMAMQLIDAYSRPLDLDSFQDDYEVALRELIDAKQKDIPLPAEEEAPEPTKVINLMDALRESVSKAKRPVASERRPAQKGPVLVGSGKRKRKAA